LGSEGRHLQTSPSTRYIGVMSTPSIDAIMENFELLDNWEDRYRYLIELGRMLEPLSDEARTPENKVQGCASQVWLKTTAAGGRIHFDGDSDAHIVKGLIAILIALLSDRPASEVLAIDAVGLFRKLGLEEHLTPQRSNGLRSMVERMRSEARTVLAAA
jgi:cysteine desulfuration protein SufE